MHWLSQVIRKVSAFGVAAAMVTAAGVSANVQADTLPFKLPEGVKFLGKGSSIPGGTELYLFQFQNGLRLMVLPDDRNPMGHVRTILDAGSNRERLGATGLAHFFEHMMFRKTKTTAEGHFDRVLAGFGGNNNAGTSTDYVVYHESFPGPALDNILELESQRFTQLDLQDPYFTTEKGAVISERRLRYENNPARRADELLNMVISRGTPYEWMTIGAKSDVENMSIAEAQKFYETFYTPDNAYMAIGGPYDVGKVVESVSKYLGKWAGKLNVQHKVRTETEATKNVGKDFVCSEAVMEQTHDLIFPTVDRSYKNYVMAGLMESMLNDSPEGDVRRRLVKKKLATRFSFYFEFWTKQKPQYTVSMALTKDQKFEAAQAFWESLVQEVLNKPFDEAVKKRYLKHQSVEKADTSLTMSAQLENYLDQSFYFNDSFIDSTTEKLVASIKQDDFRKWVKTTFAPQKRYHKGIVGTGQAPDCNTWYAAQSKN